MLLYTTQLNVRNVDETLWREVKRHAAKKGQPVGELLNKILADWLANQRSAPPADAAERARRGLGMLARLAPGFSATEELRRVRDNDVRRENELFEISRGAVQSS